MCHCQTARRRLKAPGITVLGIVVFEPANNGLSNNTFIPRFSVERRIRHSSRIKRATKYLNTILWYSFYAFFSFVHHGGRWELFSQDCYRPPYQTMCLDLFGMRREENRTYSYSAHRSVNIYVHTDGIILRASFSGCASDGFHRSRSPVCVVIFIIFFFFYQFYRSKWAIFI